MYKILPKGNRTIFIKKCYEENNGCIWDKTRSDKDVSVNK